MILQIYYCVSYCGFYSSCFYVCLVGRLVLGIDEVSELDSGFC